VGKGYLLIGDRRLDWSLWHALSLSFPQAVI
jgi:hypothetical protein